MVSVRRTVGMADPGNGGPESTPKGKLLWMTSHYGQLLYDVSRKYHFTFSFDSVLCNWVNYSHGITYVL